MEGGLTAGHLAAFNAALLLAVAAPGPAFLFTVQSSLEGGRRAGIATGAGLAVVAALWTLAALLGLDALFAAFPAAYTILSVAGAVLVLGFAVLIWRSAREPVSPAPATVSRKRAFAKGAALNLGNPKSIIFSAGVLLVIFPPGLGAAEMALITLNHALVEVVFYGFLAWVMTRDTVRTRYMGWKPTISRAMAVVLAGLGLRLLVTA